MVPKFRRFVSIALCFTFLMLYVPLRAATGGRLCILRTISGASLPTLLTQYGMQLVQTIDSARNIYLVSEPAGVDGVAFDALLQTDPNVVNAEDISPVVLAEAQLSQSTAAILDMFSNTSTTTYYGDLVRDIYVEQVASDLVNLPEAHKYASGSGVVAIIDTGIDPNHPALKRWLVPGYDFVNNLAGLASEWSDLSQSTAAILDKNAAGPLSTASAVILNQSTAAILDQSTAAILDTNDVPSAFGHGTMVAGVVHLVAPTAKIMPLKAFRADGTSNSADIIRAIYYAVDHGVEVINMSFSMLSPSTEIMRAINYAVEKGVICVASAGNLGSDSLTYPAAYRNVVSVASTSLTDRRSNFTNFGSALITLAAPGEAIVTTFPGGHYAAVWGTSFAAPFVSGTPALMYQFDSKLNSAKSSNSLAHCKALTADLGFGRLDVYQALMDRLAQIRN